MTSQDLLKRTRAGFSSEMTESLGDDTGGTARGAVHVLFLKANHAPTLQNAIANQNATVESAFSLQFAADTFDDVDAGDSLTYSATLSDGSALPSWLTFTAETRTFSGTPQSDDVGRVSITVTATDTGGLSVSDEFDLAVITVTIVTSGGTATIGDAGGGVARNDQVMTTLSEHGMSLVLTIGNVTTEIPLASLDELVFNGGAGSDAISGGAGNDLLSGVLGTDTILGAAETMFCEAREDTTTSWEMPEVTVSSPPVRESSWAVETTPSAAQAIRSTHSLCSTLRSCCNCETSNRHCPNGCRNGDQTRLYKGSHLRCRCASNARCERGWPVTCWTNGPARSCLPREWMFFRNQSSSGRNSPRAN